MAKKVMDKRITILAGPFDTQEEAWIELEEKINPEGWSGEDTPKTAKGRDNKWYVISPYAKKAKIMIENRKGHHQSGGAQDAQMVLRAGAKGKGQKIQVVHFWPWSPKSVDKAEEIMFEAASAGGFQII